MCVVWLDIFVVPLKFSSESPCPVTSVSLINILCCLAAFSPLAAFLTLPALSCIYFISELLGMRQVMFFSSVAGVNASYSDIAVLWCPFCLNSLSSVTGHARKPHDSHSDATLQPSCQSHAGITIQNQTSDLSSPGSCLLQWPVPAASEADARNPTADNYGITFPKGKILPDPRRLVAGLCIES